MGRRRVPESKVLEFCKAYLELGVVTQAAQAVGIPNSTGSDIAQRLEKDEEFVKQRQELRARYLPEVEAILRECVRIAYERVQNEPLTPVQLAELMEEHNLKSFSMPDPRPAYMAQIVNTVRVLNHKAEKGDGSQPAPNVTVNVSPLLQPETEPDPDDGGSSD